MPAEDGGAVQAASDMEDAVRALNHATFPVGDARGLNGPGDAYFVVGSLRNGARGLRQSFAQLTAFVERWHRDGRLRCDDGADVGERVGEVVTALAAASVLADDLAAELDRAQRALCWVGERER